MRPSIAAATLVLMAGCVQMEWLRPDTEPATRNEDLTRCEQQARSSALRLSAREHALIPSVSIGPGGSASVLMPPPHAPGDLALESDLLVSCMRASGYRLVPAGAAGAR